MNLNLLPSQAKFQATRMKLIMVNRRIMVGITLLWVVVMAVVMVVDVVNRQRLSSEEQKLKKVSAEYLAMGDSIIIGQKLKYKTKLVGGVLADRFEYGKAFTSVSKLFPETIRLENYSMDSGRMFKISGKIDEADKVSVLEDVVRSVNNGENDDFSEIRIVSLGYKQNRWDFGLEATLK